MTSVYAIATMDTKGEEISFVAQILRNSGVNVKLVDVGTKDSPTVVPDISREDVLGEIALPLDDDRGTAVSVMADAFASFVRRKHDEGACHGLIGIGGSGGTAIITSAMRQLPIGVPKLMVSTMASGNIAPYIDCNDITMVYSVVDVAGLNAVSTRVFSNAANAMLGMVSNATPPEERKPTLAMTMFGVTTPCVDQIRTQLTDDGFESLVFHATGSGGRAMEKLVESGFIDGVLDITTTEVADEIVGGVLSAGPARMDSLIASRLPLVVSVGALDMVNFGELDTVPQRYRDRNLYRHNPQVTLMRTTPAENEQIGRWIAEKLNRSSSPVKLVIPELGISMLDAPGQPFHDPQANAALFGTLSDVLIETRHRQIVRLPYHINDPDFARAAVESFRQLSSTADLGE